MEIIEMTINNPSAVVNNLAIYSSLNLKLVSTMKNDEKEVKQVFFYSKSRLREKLTKHTNEIVLKWC